MRAALLTVLEPLLVELAPSKLSTFREFSKHFPKRPPFAYSPLRDIIVLVSYSAHLLWPGLSLAEGSNRIVEMAVDKLQGLSVFKPMTIACQGEFSSFLEMGAQGHTMFFNTGNMTLSRPEPDLLNLYYEDVPAGLLGRIFFRLLSLRRRLNGL